MAIDESATHEIEIKDVNLTSVGGKVDARNFDLLRMLGQGSFGKVFLIRKRDGHDKGTLYAMKVHVYCVM